MVGLESPKKLRKQIKRNGTDEEIEMNKLGNNLLKLVDNLYSGEKYKEKWSSFYLLKTAFKDNVQRYQGNYLNYFENTLNEIEEQERQALGYHLYSN